MQRPLTGFETAFCLSEPQTPINFALVTHFQGEADESALLQALSFLHDRYPMAALRLDQDAEGQPCFTTENVPDFPLRVIQPAGADDWRQVTTSELGEHFDLVRGPLARATLLKGAGEADLVLTFHHGIADGMSGVYFLRDLLCLLNDVQCTLPMVPQPPDLLSLIPEPGERSLRRRAKLLAARGGLWLMARLGKRNPSAARLIDGRPPWAHFGIAHRCLDEHQTRRLVERCHQEGATVHGAVSAAWLRARWSERARTTERARWRQQSWRKQSWRERTISSPVNLRGLVDAENAFGLYMSNAITTLNCNPKRDFWAMARDIKTRIHRDMLSGRVYDWVLLMMGLMNAMPNTMRHALPDFATQPVNYDFSMTNLGRLPLPLRAGPLEVTQVHGPVVNTSEQELTVGVSTVHERLTMTLTYRDFVLAPEDAEQMADRAVAVLIKALE